MADFDAEALSRLWIAGWNSAVREAADKAKFYSNAKPGDICEVQAGDWQDGIANTILLMLRGTDGQCAPTKSEES